MKGWKQEVRHAAESVLDLAARPFSLRVLRKGHAWELIEPEQLQRFLAHFKIDCVFDVGANAGQYGQRLRAIGFSDRIVSFEPNPDVAAHLRAVASADPKWTVKELALDSQSRQCSFNIMREDQFSSLHQPRHAETAGFVNKNEVVRAMTLTTQTIAAIFPGLQAEFGFSRPFLKLDTQGHDAAVVQGAGDLIQAFVGLQSELAFTRLYEGAPDFQETLQLYRDLGFKLSALIPNNAGHFPDLNEMDCLMYNARYARA